MTEGNEQTLHIERLIEVTKDVIRTNGKSEIDSVKGSDYNADEGMKLRSGRHFGH